jgi:hypothetical protein
VRGSASAAGTRSVIDTAPDESGCRDTRAAVSATERRGRSPSRTTSAVAAASSSRPPAVTSPIVNSSSAIVCCTSERGSPTITMELGVLVAVTRYEPSARPRSTVSAGAPLSDSASEFSWVLSSARTTPSALIQAPCVAPVV